MEVVLVEDRPSMLETMAGKLERLGGTHRTWAPPHTLDPARLHPPARARAIELLRRADLVFVDAYDRDLAQDDPTASRLVGLAVVDLVGALDVEHRPIVVAYSTAMAQPALHITMRCRPIVTAAFTAAGLLDALPDVLTGNFTGALPPPLPQDWKSVHPDLRPGADLAELHQRMAGNERAWRLVWDRDAPFDQAAQKWITRQILPWLSDGDRPSYRVAVDVTRSIAGFAEAR